MERQAKQDLIMLLKAVDPLVDYTFGHPGKHPPRSPEEQIIFKQLQAASFFDEIKPILQNGLNETKIFLLDTNAQLIYPVGGHFQDNSLPIYDYYMAHKETLIKDGKIHKETIDGREYLITTIDKTNHARTNVQYIVGYSLIPNTDKFLSKLSMLVFGITGLIAMVILPFIWQLASRISNPMKHLCRQAHDIGENNFTRNTDKSNLQEIVALNTAMNEMAIRLESYDRAQKIFFENVSHELRTPLMSIRGYAEGIQYGVFEEASDPAGVIIKESDRLTILVNQLLTLSRIDNDKQSIDLQPIDLTAFLKGRLEVFRPLAQSKGISLVLEVKQTCIVADEYLLESILDNLISNSLRYAKAHILIQMTATGFLIQDDGKGFNEEELLRLFERFYKGEEGQTGLGLAIVKSSVEYMGGHIEAYNSIEGAAFKVRFKTAH